MKGLVYKELERRPGQILEGHDLTEDSTRQANMERHAEAFANHGTLRLPNDDDDKECIILLNTFL